MPAAVPVIFEVAHWMGLLPLVWLLARTARGFWYDAPYWWIAIAYAVSVVADSLAHTLDPWLLSIAFPVTQAGILGIVLLEAPLHAVLFICLLVTSGVASVLTRGVDGPDVLLATVANLGVAAIVHVRKIADATQESLLVYFGLGGLAWLAYAVWPGWTTWSVYQVCRAVGLALFCVACYRPASKLRTA